MLLWLLGFILDKIILLNVHVLFLFLSLWNIKFYWCVTEIWKFMLPIWWFNRGSYPLGNICFGVLVLNGLGSDHRSIRGLPSCIHTSGFLSSVEFSVFESNFSLPESGQETGFSERATTFTAESLQFSTRCTYDSRLAGFRKWCNSSSRNLRSASSGCIADIFISLFDKNLSFLSFRGYRSALLRYIRVFRTVRQC